MAKRLGKKKKFLVPWKGRGIEKVGEGGIKHRLDCQIYTATTIRISAECSTCVSVLEVAVSVLETGEGSDSLS